MQADRAHYVSRVFGRQTVNSEDSVAQLILGLQNHASWTGSLRL
jgi:hypothetical protein